jgi:hypothetical protein
MAMMVVMTMPKKAGAKMTAADPVVAAMPAVTVTACESLAGNGQRSGAQCQSSNRGRNDRLDLRHGRLLLGRSEDRPAMIHP